ncbi:hypothetical protein DFH94DRAFT_287893 [Russula ochroleuca]|uniref:Uncharacterized protein n=1 Tax=Russula ochroleuca TaxID=152965 RepID=A0A9P5JWS8_9AGAM|nr:hypothetical protein DFH94DRAFT_287893 [Russula ochroleuca]
MHKGGIGGLCSYDVREANSAVLPSVYPANRQNAKCFPIIGYLRVLSSRFSLRLRCTTTVQKTSVQVCPANDIRFERSPQRFFLVGLAIIGTNVRLPAPLAFAFALELWARMSQTHTGGLNALVTLSGSRPTLPNHTLEDDSLTIPNVNLRKYCTIEVLGKTNGCYHDSFFVWVQYCNNPSDSVTVTRYVSNYHLFRRLF